MRRHVQEPGIRKWSGTDLTELENEPLEAIDRFFRKYGNLVIEGCEVDEPGKSVSRGLVGLSGKSPAGEDIYHVCRFKGATNVSRFPVYLALRYTVELRKYEDMVPRPIAYDYEAELLYDIPSDRQYIQLGGDARNLFIDKIQDSDHRMVTDVEKDKWNKGLFDIDHQHDSATTEKAGFMSPGDKKKVNRINGDYALIPAIVIPAGIDSLTGEEDYDGVMNAFGGKEKFENIVNGIIKGAFLVFSGGIFVSANASISGNKRKLSLRYQNVRVYNSDILFTSLLMSVSHDEKNIKLEMNKGVKLEKSLLINKRLVDPIYVSDNNSLVRYLSEMGGFRRLCLAVKNGEPFSFYTGDYPYEQCFPINTSLSTENGRNKVDIYTFNYDKTEITHTSIRDESGTYENLSRTITRIPLKEDNPYNLPNGFYALTINSTSSEIETAVGGEEGLKKIMQAAMARRQIYATNDISPGISTQILPGLFRTEDNGDILFCYFIQGLGLGGSWLGASIFGIQFTKSSNSFNMIGGDVAFKN